MAATKKHKKGKIAALSFFLIGSAALTGSIIALSVTNKDNANQRALKITINNAQGQMQLYNEPELKEDLVQFNALLTKATEIANKKAKDQEYIDQRMQIIDALDKLNQRANEIARNQLVSKLQEVQDAIHSIYAEDKYSTISKALQKDYDQYSPLTTKNDASTEEFKNAKKALEDALNKANEDKKVVDKSELENSNRLDKINQLKEKVASIKQNELSGYDQITDENLKNIYKNLHDAILSVDGKEDILSDQQIVEKTQQLIDLVEKLNKDLAEHNKAKQETIDAYKDTFKNLNRILEYFNEPKNTDLKTRIEELLQSELNDEEISKISDAELKAKNNDALARWVEIRDERGRRDSAERERENIINEYKRVIEMFSTVRNDYLQPGYEDLLAQIDEMINGKLNDETLNNVTNDEIKVKTQEALNKYSEISITKAHRDEAKAKANAIQEYNAMFNKLEQSKSEFSEEQNAELLKTLQNTINGKISEENLNYLSSYEIKDKIAEAQKILDDLLAQKAKIDADANRLTKLQELIELANKMKTDFNLEVISNYDDSELKDIITPAIDFVSSFDGSENTWSIDIINEGLVYGQQQYDSIKVRLEEYMGNKQVFMDQNYSPIWSELVDITTEIDKHKANGLDTSSLQSFINNANDLLVTADVYNNLSLSQLPIRTAEFSDSVRKLKEAYDKWSENLAVETLKVKIWNIRNNELKNYINIKNSDVKDIAMELLNSFKDYEGKENTLENTAIEQIINQINEAQKVYNEKMNTYNAQRAVLKEQYLQVLTESNNVLDSVNNRHHYELAHDLIIQAQQGIANEITFDNFNNEAINTTITSLTKAISDAKAEIEAVDNEIVKYNDVLVELKNLSAQAQAEKWNTARDRDILSYLQDIERLWNLDETGRSAKDIAEFTKTIQNQIDEWKLIRNNYLEITKLKEAFKVTGPEAYIWFSNIFPDSEYAIYWHDRVRDLYTKAFNVFDNDYYIYGFDNEALELYKTEYKNFIDGFNLAKEEKIKSDARQAELIAQYNEYETNTINPLKMLLTDPHYATLKTQYDQLWEDNWIWTLRMDGILLQDLENKVSSFITAVDQIAASQKQQYKTMHDAMIAKLSEASNLVNTQTQAIETWKAKVDELQLPYSEEFKNKISEVNDKANSFIQMVQSTRLNENVDATILESTTMVLDAIISFTQWIQDIAFVTDFDQFKDQAVREKLNDVMTMFYNPDMTIGFRGSDWLKGATSTSEIRNYNNNVYYADNENAYQYYLANDAVNMNDKANRIETLWYRDGLIWIYDNILRMMPIIYSENAFKSFGTETELYGYKQELMQFYESAQADSRKEAKGRWYSAKWLIQLNPTWVALPDSIKNSN